MSASKGSTCAGHAPKLNHDGLHANVLAQVVEEDQVHPEHQNVLLCRELRHHTVRSEYAKYTRTNTHSILPYLESRWVAVIGETQTLRGWILKLGLQACCTTPMLRNALTADSSSMSTCCTLSLVSFALGHH